MLKSYGIPEASPEDGEAPRVTAARAWMEETGQPLPPGQFTADWASADGSYAGAVLTVASESAVTPPAGAVWVNRELIAGCPWIDPHVSDDPAALDAILSSVDAAIDAISQPDPVITSSLRPDIDALVASARRVDNARAALAKQAAQPINIALTVPVDIHLPPRTGRTVARRQPDGSMVLEHDTAEEASE